MRKEIEIGGRTVACVSNAATPVIYRQVFHEDLLVFLQEMAKTRKNRELLPGTGEMLCKLAYIMNGQAEIPLGEIVRGKLTLDGFMEWLEDFSPLDFEMAGGEILDVYYTNEKTTSKSKNV